MQTSLEGIAKRAKAHKKFQFGNLYSLLNKENLKSCFYELKKRATPGFDRINYYEYQKNLDVNIADLVERLKSRKYRAKLVLRRYIPKPNGKRRPLGIPVTEDKLVQLAVSKILSAIYEANFLPISFGYRPNVGASNAVKELTFNLQFGSFGWIVEADIKGFFDNIDHSWLIRMLKERVNDRSLLGLINKWLKAGILEEDGKILHPVAGTPQGGIVSPILANVYLHYVVDLWFEKIIKLRSKGKAMMVRYADDWVCAFQFKEDAEIFHRQLGERLKKFSLEVSPEKTSIIRFSRFEIEKNKSFEFLGFEFRWAMNHKGKAQVKRRTAPKKLKSSIQNFKEWIRKNRNKRITELFTILKSKYQGYWNYYGVHDNSVRLNKFYHLTIRILFKWLNRRSQRHSYNWNGMTDLLKWFNIPSPKIMEKPSSRRSYFLWEPLSA